MTEHLHIQALDNVYVRVHADAGVKMELSDNFTFYAPGYKFAPKFKNKLWDGKIRLLNVMTGVIYRGLAYDIVQFCERRGYSYTYDDGIFDVDQIAPDAVERFVEDIDCAYTPRDYQENAIQHMLMSHRCLIKSPTGSGKSLMIYLMARHHTELDRRVLVIVPTISLVHQMKGDFIEYNKNRELDIQLIAEGASKVAKSDIVISTWQSIVNQPKDWFHQFDVVIGDEAHQYKAKSLIKIMTNLVNAPYRYGFTGTINNEVVNKLTLKGLFGPMYSATTTTDLINNKTLADFSIDVIVLNHSEKSKRELKKVTYQEEMDWIVSCEARNRFIRRLATSLEGNTLTLFQYVDKHGKILYNDMKNVTSHNVHFIHGEVKSDVREETRHILETTTNNIALASYGVFSTGVNVVNLDNLIFASPSKSKIRNLQSIGRVLRRGNGKEKARLYDIADNLTWGKRQNFGMKHLQERYQTYINEGFDVNIYEVDLED